MKSVQLHRFCHMRSTAPALNRGLMVLAALCEQSPLSLEKLVAQLQLPKASVFRLLATLQQMGFVRKTPDRNYEPLWILQPLEDPVILYRRGIETKMAALCEATGCTVEWYEPTAQGMSLIHQKNPESELCVQAKPGFLREWQNEFEAVARLSYAFTGEAPPLSPLTMYVSNGVTKKIPVAQARKLMAAARSCRTAYDLPFNSNGVRRYAAAAFDDTGKTFLGVLALAESYHFSNRTRPETFLKHLSKTLQAS